MTGIAFDLRVFVLGEEFTGLGGIAGGVSSSFLSSSMGGSGLHVPSSWCSILIVIPFHVPKINITRPV